MAKKKVNIMDYLFLIGMIVTAVGFFLPLTSHFGGNANGNSAFSIITGSGKGLVKVGSIITLAGAVAGIILSFVNLGKSQKIAKLVSLIVSVAGGLYIFFNMSSLGKDIVKFAAKISGSSFCAGFYIIIAGWIIALIGWITSRR